MEVVFDLGVKGRTKFGHVEMKGENILDGSLDEKQKSGKFGVHMRKNKLLDLAGIDEF